MSLNAYGAETVEMAVSKYLLSDTTFSLDNVLRVEAALVLIPSGGSTGAH